ncbi:hypothetical protein SAMN05421805_105257 [Saccharopolyspora antimicrobica]|uniref:Uncharacterized protein n=2 Tax=Saccharopolyspora antimicrobica TaxID=455193 RepID=A0A1I5A5X6_9PSEU|nr:hypothetical protein ATL45_1539 [Saccharopolyspora antimicrobica]SFN57863.1 hypothetical protein SAMN05421805_105257 [Saccharopolyspora antimicrobica]
MPAMNTHWKLSAPPESEVHVDADVLAMRAPLVRVHRDKAGTWSFDGPGQSPRPSKRTLLSAVVGAWPHVAALSDLGIGAAAVWSWKQHGWAGESACECGSCDQPVAADIDRHSWPEELQPHTILSVEQAALSGQTALTDIVSTPGGVALLGPGEHRRTADLMTPVALANVIRRWPHTMQALRMLKEGHGMRWSAEGLNWHEYALA